MPAQDFDLLPPAVREAAGAVLAAPAKLLVSGGIGTGKSTVLAVLRTALRDAGRAVLTRPPRPGDAPDAAYVVDDAHLLADTEIDCLTEQVGDPAATVVVATEPLAHRPALRTLVTALERENPIVTLGALPPAEVTRILTTALGAPAPQETVRAVSAATACLPFLVRAAAGSTATAEDAARFALIERLRRIDERTRDTLLISSLSSDLGSDDVAAALGITGAEALSLVDRARAGGLVEPSHDPGFLRLVHDCIAQIAGTARHHDIETSLLRSQLELSTLSTELAVRLADHGLRDDRLADALVDHADRARSRPARAARLYRAAARAGSDALNTRLAEALTLAGDCATAGRMADELLSSDVARERADAVRIAAGIAAHDGSAAQAADLFRWLGPYPDAVVSAAGATVLIAAGDAAAARTALSAEVSGPPTSTARAARNLAEGLLLSLDQPFAATVARLGQSITTEQPAGVAPDTPAALVTLAALHGGDPVRARSVIGRAVRAEGDEGAGAIPFTAHRHRLLLGWVKMQDGQLGAATADVSAAEAGGGLHRRDALWATALRTAIARRSGDSGAVQKFWYAAMEVLAEYSIDLFSLLPLGELWVAGTRMRQVDRLEHTLAEAFGLLDALGKPVLWSVPLHWAGVHAGILANSPESVAPHGQALTAAAAQSAFARALAGAGRTWLRVLANHVDTDEVTVAARGLAQYGLTWDGTRLASQAALQTPDARVSQAMLQLARDLKQTSSADEAPLPPPTGATQSKGAGAPARLSDREREVAELLLLGMPYRDIGSQLFISAKTVEHHVARIRRRLGAESRTEMLSMLRAMLAPQG